MRQLQLIAHGEPSDVIKLNTVAEPALGQEDVLISIEAARLNPSDFMLVRGRYGVRPTLPFSLGSEGVGRVAKVGSKVDVALQGKRVLILPTYEQGTWADQAVVPVRNIVPMSDEADPLQFVMIGINPATAYLLLNRYVSLMPGDWIGQTAANSAMGQYIIKLAKLAGVKTLNVVRREEAAEQVRQSGGDRVVLQGDNLHKDIEEALGGKKLSLVLDTVGGTPVGELAKSLKTGGSVVGYSIQSRQLPAVGAAVERAGLEPDEIGTVVMGNVIQAGSKMNPARQAAINAGLPVSVPAMTVNRVCGSGAQAIVSAAHEIMSGAVDVAVAGGMENMDLAPYLIARGRWGDRMGDGQLYDSMLRDGLNDGLFDQPSGWHTQDLAQEFQITRGAQDQWAVRSQQRFAAAQTGGKFKDEIVSVEVPGRKGPVSFAADEHNRPDTTLEKLAALKPAFRAEGTITAGNAPGLNSGAAAVVLADQQWSQKRGLVPMARLVSYGVARVAPGTLGLGPIPALRQALARAGWKLGDLDP